MIRYYYNIKQGVFYIKNANGKILKVDFLGGNCLGSLILQYIDKETGTKTDDLITWFDDIKAFKKWVKNLEELGTLKDLVKVKLNCYWEDMEKLAKILAKSGVKTELYYKEI